MYNRIPVLTLSSL